MIKHDVFVIFVLQFLKNLYKFKLVYVIKVSFRCHFWSWLLHRALSKYRIL